MKNTLPIFFSLFALFVTSCTPRTTKPIYKEPPPHVRKDPVVKIKKEELIVVDAGHGGKDPGATSKRLGYAEKNYTLPTALALKKTLEHMGYTVLMTRQTDVFVPLERRAEIANEANADLFVSVHYNESQSPSADGVEVFYFEDTNKERQEASKGLCKETLQRIVKHTGAKSRGVKTANFVVIKKTKMPAILVEGGFLSSPKELEKIQSSPYRHFVAYAIARAIDIHLEKKRCASFNLD